MSDETDGTSDERRQATVKIPVAEEEMRVDKVVRTIGKVRVSTETDVTEEIARADLARETVEISETEVGEVVTSVPQVRTEGDTTIIPIFEERLVVERQLVLLREIRITRHTSRERVEVPVRLRRQKAVIEREGEEPDTSGG
ncbi:DUF2382 domain-containing protein [Prosthecomicrobium sp. N25]|uniref:DUF2382 domain-containing protein n=1 Tax=Prosthecomicrobium sp. N25 TaxID=3129254 RepID=UPI0030770A1B